MKKKIDPITPINNAYQDETGKTSALGHLALGLFLYPIVGGELSCQDNHSSLAGTDSARTN